MNESGRFPEYLLEHQYPHPIAVPFRNRQTAVSLADRGAGVLATLDATVRYIGNVLLADHFGQEGLDANGLELDASLRYPTPERWADLALKLAKQLKKSNPFMPELVDALLSSQKGGPGDLIQELALMVSEFVQGERSLAEPGAAEEILRNIEPGLLDLLGGLSFLQEYPLVQFRMTPNGGNGPRQGFMSRWMGFKREPLTLSVEFGSDVPSDRLVLVNAEATKALILDPFLQVKRCARNETDAVCMFASLRDEMTLRMDSPNGAKLASVALSIDGQPTSLFSYAANSGGKIEGLQPSSTTAQRLRFRSRLLPAESVLEGRFQSVGFIGRGGVGAVYRVFDLESKVEKAIKILYPDLSRNEFFTRYFIEVGNLLASVDHDNIVKVYEASYSKDLQENHVLMDYVPGGSLAERMQRQEVTAPKQAGQVVLGVLRGLEHLHRKGIVHGAVHPGNILFDGAGTPKVADFGIVKLPSSKNATFRPLERIQSLRYSAPETLLAGQVTEQADLYSVALVFYELITGQLPSKTDLVPPSRLVFPLPEEIDEIMERALAQRPEERFASAEEFADAVEGMLELMGIEFDVSPTVNAQRLSGHLADVYCGHLESLDKQIAAAEAKQDHEAVARFLQTRIDSVWDVEEKVHWMLRLADHYEEKLGWGGRATGLYREALTLSPDNQRAVDSLVASFESESNWEGLVELLSQLANEAETPAHSVPYLEKLVRVFSDRLSDSTRAAYFLERLVEVSGAQERWVELLFSLKEEIGDYEGAARALETWLELATDDTQRAGLLRQLAVVYERHLDDIENAISVYEKLREIDPKDIEAFKRLCDLYKKMFSYNSLSELLRATIASGMLAGADLVEAYQELGVITSSYIYNTEEAANTWAALLKVDPGNLTALSYLERLYLREGRTDDYIRILETKLGKLEEQNERTSTMLSLARARLEFLGDVSGSRELLEQVMRIDPRRRGLQEALERLHRDHGDREALVQLRLLQLEGEENPGTRMEIYWKLAELFASEPMAGMQVLMRAFKDNSRDPAVRRELEKRSIEAGALEELLNFYLGELAERTGEERDYVGSRIAMLAIQQLEGGPKAAAWLRAGLEVAPNHEGMLKGLAAIQRKGENWPDLGTTLLAQLGTAEDMAKVELFMELADLVEAHLADHEVGLLIVDALFDVLPLVKSRHTIEALNKACRATQDWSRLTELLEQEEKLEDDPVKALPLRLALGQAWTDRGEFERAVPYLERVLERMPEDRNAQDSLEKSLLALERWKDLSRLYRNWVSMESDIERKIRMLDSAVAIELKAFGNVDGALELYRQLQVLAPTRQETYDGLVEMLTAAQRWSDLSIALTAASKTSQGARKLEMLSKLADVYADKLENPDGAIETLRQLLNQDPSNTPALERLEGIARENSRFEALVRVLDERLWPLKGAERLPWLLKMARVAAVDMGLVAVARRHLDEAMMVSPESDEAFKFYEELLLRHEEYKELARLYDRRFAVVADDGDKVDLGLRMATLLWKRLQARVRAIEVLEQVLELDPKHAQATLALASLYAIENRYDKAAPLLMALQTLKVFLENEEQHEALFLSGLTYENLLDRNRAVDAFRACIEIGYKASESRRHLAELLYLDGKVEEAQAAVAEVLQDDAISSDQRRHFEEIDADLDRKLGQLDKSQSYLLAQLAKNPSDKEVLAKLIALANETQAYEVEAKYVKALLQVEPSSEKRLPLLLRLGELLKDGEEAELAAGCFQEAMDITGKSRGLMLALANVWIRLERYDDAAAILREAEEAETEVGKKAQLALTQALLYADYAGDKRAAAEHFKRVLALDLSRWEAFTALETIYVDSGDWQAQKELYEFCIEKVDPEQEPELAQKLRKNLGRILIEKFGDTKGAVAQLQKSLELFPDDLETREIVAGIYLQGDDELDKALEEYRGLIMRQPRNTVLIHLLRKTLSRMKRYDEVWCVTGVLQLLGDITPKEKAFYDKLLAPTLRIRPKTLDADMLRNTLVAPDEDWELSQIIRVAFDRMGDKLSLRSPKDLGYSKKDLLQKEEAGMVWTLLEVMGQILGISTPQTFIREGATWWVTKEGSNPPVLLLGREALDSKRGKEARFELGKAMSLFTAGHLAVGVLDRQVMQLLVGNLLKLVQPELPELPGDPKANAELRKEMQKVVPAVELGRVRESLAEIRRRGSELNIKRWLVGVEKSSARFGLLMANDIEVAAAMTRSAPAMISTASRDEVIDDLIKFAVSAQYAALRAHLEISVV